MGKLLCVVSCPIDCYAGYGGRARDIVKELLKNYPEWDIRVLSQRWGQCRMGYLEDHKEAELAGHIISNLTEKPDIWIQITVPNEFQPVGKFNIGITAGIETTACDASWVEGCNRMNLIITSSKHGKFSLDNTRYQKKGYSGFLEVKTPIEILFEGVDKKVYKTLKQKHSLLSSVDTNWNFLVVGHWLPGDFGHDRKNIGYTIKAFLEAFKDYKGPGSCPGLILKTSTRGCSSITDQREILNRIYNIRESVAYKDSLPNIYVLHGDLSDQEINELYNDPKVKVMISFTKGEGYGRPLAEFASIGKPILCSGWSGQLDFLNKEYVALIGGTLEKVHPSAAVEGMILPETSWFKPDDNQVLAGLKELYKYYSFWLDKAKKEAKIISSEFSLEKMGEKLKEILDRNLPVFPEKVELNLPDISEMFD